MMRALTVAAAGEKADIAKPFKGIDGGVFEIAVKYRGTPSAPFIPCRSATMFGSWMRFRKNPKVESKRHRWTSTGLRNELSD